MYGEHSNIHEKTRNGSKCRALYLSHLRRGPRYPVNRELARPYNLMIMMNKTGNVGTT